MFGRRPGGLECLPAAVPLGSVLEVEAYHRDAVFVGAHGEPDRVAMLSDLRKLETNLKIELKALIAEEGKTTRRHFDVMVESVEGSMKLVAEATAHHAVVLDNHESRLTRIEKKR